MEQEFLDWLGKQKTKAGKRYKPEAADIYSKAIDDITDHYFRQTGEISDLYKVTDPQKIRQIVSAYGTSGKFAKFGYKGEPGTQGYGRFSNGTWRNAIQKYAEFFAQKGSSSSRTCKHEGVFLKEYTAPSGQAENDSDPVLPSFASGKYLQIMLQSQISKLFPGYKIFDSSDLGIEYSIEDREVPVLLEKLDTGDLLVVELKPGLADNKVFGQISTYIGSLKGQFPGKSISAIIVADHIDETLRQACAITDKVMLKTYKINLELEDA